MRFFHMCAGVLILAITYGLDAQHVEAQSNPRILDVAATPAVGGGIASKFSILSGGYSWCLRGDDADAKAERRDSIRS